MNCRDCESCKLYQLPDKTYEELTVLSLMISEGVVKIAEMLPNVINAICEILPQILALYPDKRVLYLASHGKPRTRRKNIKRIAKYFGKDCI